MTVSSIISTAGISSSGPHGGHLLEANLKWRWWLDDQMTFSMNGLISTLPIDFLMLTSLDCFRRTLNIQGVRVKGSKSYDHDQWQHAGNAGVVREKWCRRPVSVHRAGNLGPLLASTSRIMLHSLSTKGKVRNWPPVICNNKAQNSSVRFIFELLMNFPKFPVTEKVD